MVRDRVPDAAALCDPALVGIGKHDPVRLEAFQQALELRRVHGRELVVVLVVLHERDDALFLQGLEDLERAVRGTEVGHRDRVDVDRAQVGNGTFNELRLVLDADERQILCVSATPAPCPCACKKRDNVSVSTRYSENVR